MKIAPTFFLLAILLLSAPFLSLTTRSQSSGPSTSQPRGKPTNPGNKGGGRNDPGGMGGFFGPGAGFGIPDFGKGWGNDFIGGGYGSGYGGPRGGYGKSGVIRPTVVCQEKGPCYKKKLTCPAKCFTSYTRSGKGYGGGGGGGGCTMDCKKKCIAYC